VYQVGTLLRVVSESRDECGVVIKVRDTWRDPLQFKTLRRDIYRGRHLVYILLDSGDIRSYYPENGTAYLRPISFTEKILRGIGVKLFPGKNIA
jgi:hypothetical protein